MDRIRDIAKMIDHSILHPTFTDEDLRIQCEIAKKYRVATVCVKPYHARLADDFLDGSEVVVCSVIGFPHGNSTVDVKAAEIHQVIRDGAAEIDMVINIGKVVQGDWAYVERELHLLHYICHDRDTIVKVIFETDFLTRDDDKIRLCELCSAEEVEFVKTSTGYGFTKGTDGKYSTAGATEHDINLMRKHCSPGVQIKAAGGIRTLDQLLRFSDLGVTRIGATATESIMEEAKRRFSISL